MWYVSLFSTHCLSGNKPLVVSYSQVPTTLPALQYSCQFLPMLGEAGEITSESKACIFSLSWGTPTVSFHTLQHTGLKSVVSLFNALWAQEVQTTFAIS